MTHAEKATATTALKNLSYAYYNGEKAFPVLQDVNIRIDAGEFVAIMGPSGSGKSTLMNILGTLAVARDGECLFGTKKIDELSEEELATFRNEYIGFVFQQFHLLPRLTVIENVLLPLQYARRHAEDDFELKIAARGRQLLVQLGIGNQADKYPAELSGGQKQRVAIARALLLKPKMILADEPTGALDSQSSREVLNIFAELHQQGHTIIIITHDPEVGRYAKRLIEIRDGKIINDAQQPGTAQQEGKSQQGDFVAVKDNLASVSDLAPAKLNWRDKLSAMTRPWRSAWQALASSPRRTFLTSLGLVIGVCAIIIMITLGHEAEKTILKIFAQDGADKVYVGLDGRKMRALGGGYWRGIDVNTELPALQKVMAQYGKIIPLLSGNMDVGINAGGLGSSTRVTGIQDHSHFVNSGIKITKGRFFTPREYDEGTVATLVGAEFADNFFPKTYSGRVTNRQFPIGEIFSVNNNYFSATLTIVGVLKKKDFSFGNRNVNEQFYVTNSTLVRYSGDPYADWFAIETLPDVSQKKAADALVNFLKLKAGIKFEFMKEIPEQQIAKIMQFIMIFQGLTTVIGGLCILVGGVGIMNIMLVTITERIKEIGLKKALGASQRHIKWQFLQECILLCISSGIVATLISFLFCNGIGALAHKLLPDLVAPHLIFNSTALLVGLITSLGCGFAFGMTPALKAAHLDPSEALRGE